MNQRITIILVVALVLSLGASFVVFQLVRSRLAQAPPPATAQILVAARQLEIGTMVKDADVKTAPWTGSVPKGMITDKKNAVGRGVLATIYEGEPVLDNRIAAPGAGAGLAATIPPGMRAAAIRVDDIVGVAGFVVPGMRVDVLIQGNPPNGSAAAGPKVKTLLQNIQVLSAGQNYQKDAEGKPILVPVVNVLVTPEQAEILSLASNATRIQLILRNPLDTETSKTKGLVLSALYNEGGPSAPKPVVMAVAKPAPPPPPPAPVVLPPYSVEVINGPQRSEARFVRPPEEKQ
jgi:pilus assembly protein CpaB